MKLNYNLYQGSLEVYWQMRS